MRIQTVIVIIDTPEMSRRLTKTISSYSIRTFAMTVQIFINKICSNHSRRKPLKKNLVDFYVKVALNLSGCSYFYHKQKIKKKKSMYSIKQNNFYCVKTHPNLEE